MRMDEQIARDAEVARIHAEEEIQGMIDSLEKSNETIAKYLQEYQQFASELPLEKKIELISDLVKYHEHYTKVHKFQSQQRRPMTKKQKREYYMAVIKSNLGWRFKDFKEDREAVASKPSGEDALIKGRSNNEGEAAGERISNDSEEIARVLTSMDAATVLAGETNVPTGSSFIPTAGLPATVISTGSEVGPTASPIVTRRKGKEVMVESDTPKKKKLQEQIDAQVSRELKEQQERERI
nr:hypothetical protein [Tanacetum cinerariifolium]